MQIRPATDNDLGFIYETFLRSFRAASTHAEGLDNKQVVSLLASLIRKGWQAKVADTEGYLAGWIVAGGSIELGWIYVRDMFRGNGVGKQLLASFDIDTKKKIVSPFLPNRQKRTWQIIHRPFEVVA